MKKARILLMALAYMMQRLFAAPPKVDIGCLGRAARRAFWRVRLRLMGLRPIMGGSAGPLILDRFDIIEGFPAVDLQTAANNGDYISAKNAKRIAIVFVSGVGTASDDPTLTVQQATSAAGGSVKALNFTVIYRKQAATDLSGTTAWTKTTQTAANTYTNATSAEQSLIWVVEVDPIDLDVANGFDYIRATVADIGANAQPGYLFYLLEKMYPCAPANNTSNL